MEATSKKKQTKAELLREIEELRAEVKCLNEKLRQESVSRANDSITDRMYHGEGGRI